MAKFLLFDLGGVLVGLSGIARMIEWTGLSEAECWSRWLQSPAVRDFESGRTQPEGFAAAIKSEFGFPVSEQVFLAEFTLWPTGFFRGAKTLLKKLRVTYRTGCLTNINEIHWKRAVDEWKVGNFFDLCLASHELGLVKPDAAVFERAVERIGQAASTILYFDDSSANVAAAKMAGLDAHQVRGLVELKVAIDSLIGGF